MADPYIIPRRLDDPELIGFWTIDEFAGMLAPFTWGILTQHTPVRPPQVRSLILPSHSTLTGWLPTPAP